MTGVLFILFGFVSIICEGKITAPPDGTVYTFLPGSTESITWTFDDDPSNVISRTWSFTSKARSGTFAILLVGNQPTKIDGVLPSFDIKTPATLTLNNVNQSYNGTYQLALDVKGGVLNEFKSDVTVFIAITPRVTVNCSKPTTLNQSQYFACVCNGQGGNPPSDVIWYKGNPNEPIVRGKEEAILRFPNVGGANNGTYTCRARSGISEATNKTTIALTVNYPPERPRLKYDAESLTITCEGGEARPPARFEIFVNTTLVMSNKTYTIPNMNSSYAGKYKCVASNILGSSSSFPKDINPGGPRTSTTSRTIIIPSRNETGKDNEKSESGTDLSVGAIIGIVIGVLVLLVIIIVVVWRYKMKEKDGYRGKRDVGAIEMHDQNEYDSVRNEASGSGSKPQASKPPPVYAQVDKNNREGKPLYATLDTAAMNTKGSNRRSEENHPEPTQYASIDFEKSGEVPKADLV